MLPARSTMQLNVASDLLSPAVSAAMALPAGNAAAATSVAAITEFSLPQPGMQPGPIIAAGQNVLFGSVASCSGPCGVYSISATGATVPAGNGCVGQNCRHTGLAPTADGGYCYAVTNQLFDGELKDPIIACSTKAFQASHFLHAFNGTPAGLALAADGSIWFTDVTLNGIGRIAVLNTAVVNATYLDPTTGLGLGAIAGGPDGSMWFAAINANKIGRVVNGELSLMGIPTADSQPAGVIVGPDGNLWFAEFKANKIGRLTPAGVFTEFSLPTVDAQPLGIATGPDGALWFTEFNGNKIGRISRFGDISEYPVPTASSQPAGIVTGPDGNLWFTELQGNKIGKLVPAPASTAPQVIEFYNTPLDTFFITANAAEAAAIDSGSAGPGWSRTGSTFSSGGSTPVCRFYGSVTPGPNSHFYTADAAECQALKDLQAATPATQPRWNFESLDFSTTPAVNGACAAGLVPVYRAYNNGAARGVGSNHRITGSPGAIAEVVQRGWISEGVVMCSPA